MEENKFIPKLDKYFTSNRKLAFLVTFFTALIAHFSCYSQLVSTTDTFVNGSYYLPGEWEISLGRWGIYFLNVLRFGIVSPFFISLISFFVLGLTSILINDLLKINSKILIIIISMLIATSPYVYNILLYIYTADSYFISMFLAVLAAKFILEKSRKYDIYGIMCIILSFSIYQTFISITICLITIIIFFEYIKGNIDFRNFLKKILKAFLKISVALILYYIITKIILKVMGIEMSNYYGINDDFRYIILNLFNGIIGAYNDWISYYFSNLFTGRLEYAIDIIYIIIFTTLNINIVFIILKNSRRIEEKFTKILCWYILFLILPLMQNAIRLIVPTSAIAPTTIASYIISIILYIGTIEELVHSKKIKKINYFGVLLIVYLIYANIFIGEATYIALEKNYNQIHSQLIRVIDRIENVEEYTEDMKIKIVGGKDYREHISIYEFASLNRRVGFFGDVGNISLTYLKEEFGIKNEFATDEEMEEIYITDEYKNMKEFPDKESIKFINNVIVVKLESNEYSINKTN